MAAGLVGGLGRISTGGGGTSVGGLVGGLGKGSSVLLGERGFARLGFLPVQPQQDQRCGSPPQSPGNQAQPNWALPIKNQAMPHWVGSQSVNEGSSNWMRAQADVVGNRLSDTPSDSRDQSISSDEGRSHLSMSNFSTASSQLNSVSHKQALAAIQKLSRPSGHRQGRASGSTQKHAQAFRSELPKYNEESRLDDVGRKFVPLSTDSLKYDQDETKNLKCEQSRSEGVKYGLDVIESLKYVQAGTEGHKFGQLGLGGDALTDFATIVTDPKQIALHEQLHHRQVCEKSSLVSICSLFLYLFYLLHDDRRY